MVTDEEDALTPAVCRAVGIRIVTVTSCVLLTRMLTLVEAVANPAALIFRCHKPGHETFDAKVAMGIGGDMARKRRFGTPKVDAGLRHAGSSRVLDNSAESACNGLRTPTC